jgi:hypothetical protein
MACQYDLSIRLRPSDRAHDEMPLPHLEKSEVLLNAMLSVRDFPFEKELSRVMLKFAKRSLPVEMLGSLCGLSNPIT